MDYNEQIRLIRKSFFAYRNGIIADSLRKCNDPHKSIMGCQWIDVMTIAHEVPQDVTLAEKLWEIKDSRECRMIATLLYPVRELDVETALVWAKDVESDEIADILCQALLGKMNDAMVVFNKLLSLNDDKHDYIAFRLLQNIIKRGNASMTNELTTLVKLKMATADKRVQVILADLLEDCQQ